MLEFRRAFVFETVTRTAAAGAGGVAALDHKVGDDAVEFEPVVVTALGEVEEVGDGDGGLRGVEDAFDVAFVGFDDDADVFHGIFTLRGCSKDGEGESGGEDECFVHSVISLSIIRANAIRKSFVSACP